MSELFFIIKSIFLTFVVIILFQVKIGETTLEEKTLHWAQQSTLLQPLHEVASGGIIVLREGWKVFFGNLNSKFFSRLNQNNLPGQRELNLTLKRSEEFLRDQAQKLKNPSETKTEAAEALEEDETEASTPIY